MTIYLGAPEPSWIGYVNRPLMVSYNRFRRLRDPSLYPVAGPATPWILDSGAYDLITRHGGYPDDTEAYVRRVRSYAVRVGGLVWAAPQDMPCGAAALARTGLTAVEHVVRSVDSFIEVTAWWGRLETRLPSPFRPVVQGDAVADYLRCLDYFNQRGIELAGFDVVGVGSVCRRERLPEIAEVVAAVRERTGGARLHGFGVKAEALGLFDDADSMAWSKAARSRRARHPECTQFHPVCSSCPTYAEAWHDELTSRATA